MLRKLVFRNVKKQIKEYLIYWITLVFTVVLMYSFNNLFFGNMFQQLLVALSQGTNSFDYVCIIVLFLIIVVTILTWFVSYMTNYMLKKRSEEIGIYMILGIEKLQIMKIFLYESVLVGATAVVCGLILGTIFSKMLYVMLLNMFEYGHNMTFDFSVLAMISTIVSFGVIYSVAWILGKKRIEGMQLIELINYKRKGERAFIKNDNLNYIYILISTICYMIGAIVLKKNKISFLSIGLVILFFVLFTLLLFKGGAGIVEKTINKSQGWKLKRNRIFGSRILSNRINFISSTISFASIIFMLSIICIGITSGFIRVMDQTLESTPFDMSILHPGSSYDYSKYEIYIRDKYNVEQTYSYNVYTSLKTDFADIRNSTLNNYWNKIGKDIDVKDVIYSENKYDNYIKYSDYCNLRKIMGLNTEKIESDEYIIQCMPFLKDRFREKSYTLNNEIISCKKIYTDAFGQLDGYGNGQGYIIVVPDEKIRELEISYSLFVANTTQILDDKCIQEMKNNFINVKSLSDNIVADDGQGYATKLCFDGMNYIKTKYEMKATNQAYLLIIPLFYIAIIAGVIGVVILATWLLTDNRNIFDFFGLASVLGMEVREMKLILKKIILLYFSLPMILAIFLGGKITKIWGCKLLIESFSMPVFASYEKETKEMVIIALILFLSIYVLYVWLTHYIIKKNTLLLIHN